MTEPVLRMVTRTQGNNAALKDGRVRPAGFALEFEEVPVLVKAFRRMVRGLEFDVCEMALTTYLCAREHGVRFTALPIFLVRAFHHGAILRHRELGPREPKALEGRRVGVNRGYTVTTGVWARAILAEEHGVELDKVTWVLSGDEHVAAYVPPPNVVPLESKTTIEQELRAGRLASAINIETQDSAIVPLIESPLEAGFKAFAERGHYPINHLIVVRDDVLERHPELGASLFAAFAESKALYLERLQGGEIDAPTAADRLHLRMLELGHDPLPYGIEPNRAVLENLIAHAHAQQILRRPVALDTLFAPGTERLSA